MLAAQDAYLAHISEGEFQTKITDFCDYLHLKWHHETDSRKSKRGFPDLVIAGSRVIFAELKSQKGRVSVEQTEWIDRLRAAGAEIYLWRPGDWREIQAILLGLADGTRRIV